MIAAAEKKTTAKARQRKVASEFQKWLESHPNAPKRKRINQFNAISDSAFLEEQIRES